ncbi:sigma-70 family RNA polymerase sigma factor [Tautonia plasticadhaerens]|uniref:ECF RNA polymerase sigma factor SigE n=1 Tax=Tautonia plasticadhaerens TaxID=2527974 RepID=A0A518HBH1_9BACT|nr:sigma-70 family RNA polymerase sigma factor [Tautonia plasticadhaerens]QDV38204.1 ECF RNA polymerase sigma factor SigE [Tautonia plasticadhaerens]
MAARGTGAVLKQVGAIFRGGSVAALTDGELLERFADRADEEAAEAAFEAIVARHGPMVLGVCRRVVPDPIDAEDAFQATFLVLARKAGSVRVDDSAGRWLYGVARRVATRARKRSVGRREVGVPAAPEAASPDPGPLDLALTRERAALLRDEVDRLPARYREAVVLCHFEGRSLDEAASRLGRPVGTVKARLSRARAMLRARLSRRGLGLGVLPVVPGPLLRRTVTLAVRDAFRSAPAGIAGAVVSGSVAHLAEGVIAMTGWVKVQAAGVALLSVGVTAAAVGGLGGRQDGTPKEALPVGLTPGAASGVGADAEAETPRFLSSTAEHGEEPTRVPVARSQRVADEIRSVQTQIREARELVGALEERRERISMGRDVPGVIVEAEQELQSNLAALRLKMVRLAGALRELEAMARPEVTVEVAGPEGKVIRGSTLGYQVTVRNEGRSRTGRTTLVATLSGGLVGFDDHGKPTEVRRFELSIDELEPGRRSGPFLLNVLAEGEGGQRIMIQVEDPDGVRSRPIDEIERVVEIVAPESMLNLEPLPGEPLHEADRPESVRPRVNSPPMDPALARLKIQQQRLLERYNQLWADLEPALRARLAADEENPTQALRRAEAKLSAIGQKRGLMGEKLARVDQLKHEAEAAEPDLDVSVYQDELRKLNQEMLELEYEEIEARAGLEVARQEAGKVDPRVWVERRIEQEFLADPDVRALRKELKEIQVRIDEVSRRLRSGGPTEADTDEESSGAPLPSNDSNMPPDPLDPPNASAIEPDSLPPDRSPFDHPGRSPSEADRSPFDHPGRSPSEADRSPFDHPGRGPSEAERHRDAGGPRPPASEPSGGGGPDDLPPEPPRMEFPDRVRPVRPEEGASGPFRVEEEPVEPGPNLPEERAVPEWDPELVEEPDHGPGVPRESEKATLPEYVVEPPDLIRIEVLEALPGRPIAGERLVRPDGTISLDFYGDLYVAGLTPSEIKEKVILHLREFLDDESLGLIQLDPETLDYAMKRPGDSDRVFVDVVSYNSKVYYVQGDVIQPGRLNVTGNETVLDAINYAGGLLPTADRERIRLVRPSGTGDPAEVLPIDLEAIVERGDASTNYQLLPGDRLVVPRDLRILVEQAFLALPEVQDLRAQIAYQDRKIEQLRRVAQAPSDPGLIAFEIERKKLMGRYSDLWEERSPGLRARVVGEGLDDPDRTLGGPPPVDEVQEDGPTLYRFSGEDEDATAIEPELVQSLRELVERLDAVAVGEEPGTFTVTGGVQTPGRFLIPGELRITDALELTGGTEDVPGTVFLLRRGAPIRKFSTIRGSLGRGEEDVLIQPGDQLVIRTYPPRSEGPSIDPFGEPDPDRPEAPPAVEPPAEETSPSEFDLPSTG